MRRSRPGFGIGAPGEANVEITSDQSSDPVDGKTYKKAYCVHGNPCHERDCIEYGRWARDVSSDPVDIDKAVDELERIIHPEGRCVTCGGGKPYWKHEAKIGNTAYHEFVPPVSDISSVIRSNRKGEFEQGVKNPAEVGKAIAEAALPSVTGSDRARTHDLHFRPDTCSTCAAIKREAVEPWRKALDELVVAVKTADEEPFSEWQIVERATALLEGKDPMSVTGSINSYDELIHRAEQYSGRTKASAVATGQNIVQMMRVFRPKIEADFQREAVETFIRDELLGLLSNGLLALADFDRNLLVQPNAGVTRDTAAMAIAAKIKELRDE